MAQRTAASEVAEMESDLALFRNECEILRRDLAIATNERDSLKVEVALLQTKAQEELIRATQMETIMSQVSTGLVSGLKKMQDERLLARDIRRAQQQRDIIEEASDKPEIAAQLVKEPAHKPAAIDGRPQPTDLDIVRSYAPPHVRLEKDIRNAAEAITPSPSFVRSGQQASVADARLPRVILNETPDENPDDADEENLRALAANIGVS